MTTVNLFYEDIKCINRDTFNGLITLLPEFMQREILSYRHFRDQNSRLIARLMLLKILSESGKRDLIERWQIDKHKKPFIRNWFPFNISHSGDIVVFCYAQKLIGVDIEMHNLVDFEVLSEYFDCKEQKCILEASNPQLMFYQIWTKKEAFLKATGVGIVNGLNTFNCLGNSIEYFGRRWYFHEFSITKYSSGYLCYPEPLIEIKLHIFDSHKLLNH